MSFDIIYNKYLIINKLSWIIAFVKQACVLQRQRKGSVSSDASGSTDSNTYYEDDFSSTEEDSSQGIWIDFIHLLRPRFHFSFYEFKMSTQSFPYSK